MDVRSGEPGGWTLFSVSPATPPLRSALEDPIQVLLEAVHRLGEVVRNETGHRRYRAEHVRRIDMLERLRPCGKIPHLGSRGTFYAVPGTSQATLILRVPVRRGEGSTLPLHSPTPSPGSASRC